MSIASKNTLTWNDIKSLYTRLNTELSRFSASQIGVPTNPGIADNSSIKTLSDAIEVLESNQYVGSVARTNITVPNGGTIITPVEFNSMSTTIDNISRQCVYNSSYDSAHRGYNSSYDSAHRGYNSSYNTSDDDYNSSYRTSYDSSHRSHDSSHHSGYDSSHSCSCVNFNFAWYSTDSSCSTYRDYRA